MSTEQEIDNQDEINYEQKLDQNDLNYEEQYYYEEQDLQDGYHPNQENQKDKIDFNIVREQIKRIFQLIQQESSTVSFEEFQDAVLESDLQIDAELFKKKIEKLKEKESELNENNLEKLLNFIDPNILQLKKIQKNIKKKKKQTEKKKSQWFTPKINSNIYVRGLPDDITISELKEFFEKAGIIRIDILTGEPKIKLYKDEKGQIKGDCIVSYAKEESVDLAIEQLNERYIKPGYKVFIQQAEFQQKGNEYIKREPKTQKINKEDKINIVRFKTKQDQMFSWDEEDQGEGLKIVILENMFSLEEIEDDPELFFKDLTEDIKSECEKKCGPIARIKIYEQNPNGIVQIKFKEAKSALECIELMNGRYFGGKMIVCDYYDGVTNYNKVENALDDERRIEEFGNWLEQTD